MARVGISWDTHVPGSETGRVYGQRGFMTGMTYNGDLAKLPDLERPALPPQVGSGGHGGSHGHLTNEFLSAILLNRKPLVDVVAALNMTVAGVVAHQSAVKDGETLKVPQFS
jgi:hypothetical protein